MLQGVAGRQTAAGGRAGGAAGDPVYSGFLRTLLTRSSRLTGHTCVSLSAPGKSPLFTKWGLHTVLPDRPLWNPAAPAQGLPAEPRRGSLSACRPSLIIKARARAPTQPSRAAGLQHGPSVNTRRRGRQTLALCVWSKDDSQA